MSKVWLLTMTQERRDDISKMISNIYPTFDGIVALVNQPSNDRTYELLEENKGEGRILKQDFTPNHGFLMNHLLFYGGIKEGDWCLYLDSPESMTDDFIYALPYILEKFDNDEIGAGYWDSRPYIFKYNPYMEFFGAVHWGLKNIEGKIAHLPSEKDKFIINRRKETPKYYGSLNGTKYYLCYPLGNDIELVYGKYGNGIPEAHEQLRKNFRSYCLNKLKLNLNNLNDMINYMIQIRDKKIIPENEFINMVELEFRLSELFQIEVLGMDLIKDIVPRRYRWSFIDYLKTGDGFINPDYKSTIIQYQEKFNIKEG